MAAPTSRSERFSTVPINRHLGLVLVAVDAQGAEVTLPACPEYLQEEGVVHGGLLATLADTAAVYALIGDLPAGQTMTSIEFKLNFLRAARAGGGDLRARSRIVRRGRKVSLVEVDVHQADRHVARGLFTYLVYDKVAD